MLPVNVGYDNRPLAMAAPSGSSGGNTGFFQQVAVGGEAINDHFQLNATVLLPVGVTRRARAL